MKYITREAERKIQKMDRFFKVVLVTGARQVGKTTMLKHLSEGTERNYVTLDDMMIRDLAKSDPKLFFQMYRPPILIDEVQYAPELFEQIKIICDNTEETGLFWLTGSQQFHMMKHVRETLAGRVGIVNLYGLSWREKKGIIAEDVLDFSLQGLAERRRYCPQNNVQDVFEHIWRGGMPQVLEADEEMRIEYFNSYIDTYLMRDVTEAGGITDYEKFKRLLKAAAALVSEQLNYSNLAAAADISVPTAKEWIKVLEGLGIIYLLPPYVNNELKRLVKSPKLYFCDTGLCAYLSMWLTRATLMSGAASGHFYENYVVMELVKGLAYSRAKGNLTYYRDANAKEIDLFLEAEGEIHPLEIKQSASPRKQEIKKFDLLDKAQLKRGAGGIVCMCDEIVPIDDKNCFIPSNLI